MNASQAVERGMRTSTGLPIKHADLVARLYTGINLPKRVAILNCKGHSKGAGRTTQGNDAADEAAKKAGGYQMIMTTMPPQKSLAELLQDVQGMQSEASPEERSDWKGKGCFLDSQGVWVSPDQKPTLTARALRLLLVAHHQRGHEGGPPIRKKIERDWWAPHVGATAKHIVDQCVPCQKHKIAPCLKPGLGAFPAPQPTVPGNMHGLHRHGGRSEDGRVPLSIGSSGQILPVDRSSTHQKGG